MRQRKSKIQMHREYLARFGFRVWALRALCAIARRLLGFRAINGMTLVPEDIESKYLAGPPEPFTHHVGSAREFAALPGAKALESEAFYEGAAERGDWCHYILHGETIASYGWYATRPVHALDEAWIGFSPEYVYMYKGFTVPEFRGRQLHAHGMALATLDAVARGYRGLISFVEIQNESSLRSVARLGYRIFGSCFKVRALGRTKTFRTSGCVPHGFRLFVPSMEEERTEPTTARAPVPPAAGPERARPMSSPPAPVTAKVDARANRADLAETQAASPARAPMRADARIVRPAGGRGRRSTPGP